MGTTVTFTVNERVLKYATGLVLVLLGLAIGMIINAQTATAQAGAVEDTAYTAITPCASFDSRTDTGGLAGQYSHFEVRDFQITGTAPAAQQFGINCGVPADADAVLVNIVAIAPTTGGNFRAFATGDTGTGGVVNYAAVSPNLNNSNAVVVPLSSAGEISIQNNCGGCAGTSAHARGIILGYFTDNLAQRVTALEAGDVSQLVQRVADLEAGIEDLEALLEDVTRDNGGPNNTDRLLFTGMNLQLVDGTGNTPCTGSTCNGQGNLIVGYNEDSAFQTGTATRTGSHGLIIGEDHEWTSYGHLLAGFGNTATGSNSTAAGGWFNTADGTLSSVTGGQFNEAGALASSITGGSNNTTSVGGASSVSGGSDNTASGNNASVTGGEDNTASGSNSSVTGGSVNTASGVYSSITGGGSGNAGGERSSVSGGLNNRANGSTSSVTGGSSNFADGQSSSVSGGGANTATEFRSSISGGFGNSAQGQGASVTGGTGNSAVGSFSSVSGGSARTATDLTNWRAGSLFENN